MGHVCPLRAAGADAQATRQSLHTSCSVSPVVTPLRVGVHTPLCSHALALTPRHALFSADSKGYMVKVWLQHQPPSVEGVEQIQSGGAGPASTSFTGDPRPSSRLVWWQSAQVRPRFRAVAYLGRPLRGHWDSGLAPSHLSPRSRPVPLLPHTPCFPGLQTPLLAAGRADSRSCYVHRPQPRQIWL